MRNCTYFLLVVFVFPCLWACGAEPSSAPKSAEVPESAAAAPDQPSPGATVGSVDGHALIPQSMASVAVSDDSNGLLLVVSNQNDYCAAIAAGKTHPNHVALAAILVAVGADGNTQAVTPGTYAVSGEVSDAANSKSAIAAFRASDAACNDLMDDEASAATGGTVTLTAVGPNAAAGSYEVSFAGGTVRGSFSAPTCTALVKQATNEEPMTCAP